MGKKGFTLIELIVSLAVAAILGLTMVQLLAPIYRTYQRVSARADAQLIAGNVLDVLRRNAAKAESVMAITGGERDAVQIGRSVFTVRESDGLLYQEEEPVFAPSYYGGKDLTMTVSQKRENMAEVTVYLSTAQEGVLAEASTMLSPLVNIVTEYEADTAAGMYLDALAAIAHYEGTGGADGIFNLIKNGYSDAGFPLFNIEDLISKSRLNTLAAQAAVEAGNNTNAPLPVYYRTLGNAAFYLVSYVATAPDGTYLPVIYLTNAPEELETKRYAPAYLVYFNGIWYARAKENVASMNAILSFNGLSEAEIVEKLSIDTNWTSVRALKE